MNRVNKGIERSVWVGNSDLEKGMCIKNGRGGERRVGIEVNNQL